MHLKQSTVTLSLSLLSCHEPSGSIDENYHINQCTYPIRYMRCSRTVCQMNESDDSRPSSWCGDLHEAGAPWKSPRRQDSICLDFQVFFKLTSPPATEIRVGQWSYLTLTPTRIALGSLIIHPFFNSTGVLTCPLFSLLLPITRLSRGKSWTSREEGEVPWRKFWVPDIS